MSISPIERPSCFLQFQGYVKLSTTVVDVLYRVADCASSVFAFLAKVYNSLASFPVLKSFMDACRGQFDALSVLFEGINKVCELKTNGSQLQHSHQKLNQWAQREEIIRNFKEDFTFDAFQPKDNEKNGKPTERQERKRVVLMHACQEVNKARKVPIKTAFEAFINVKNERLNVKIQNLKIERVKYHLTIAHSISHTVGAIAALAVSVGIVIAGSSPMPLLFMAIVTTSLAVGKQTYGAYHKNAKETAPLSDLQLDVVNQYKLLKHREIKAVSE